MNVQSRTYNNGTILEYTYTIIPAKGDAYHQTIYVDVNTGEIIDPNSVQLTLDMNSENSFQGVCCNDVLDDICVGWITEAGACWTTEAGLSWAV